MLVGTQHLPCLWIDPVRPRTGHADPVVIDRIIGDPTLEPLSPSGTAEREGRHAANIAGIIRGQR